MKDVKDYLAKPGHKVHLDDLNPDDRGPLQKEEAVEETEKSMKELDNLQERLYAEGKHALLIVLQAIDTGGKDGTIRHVMKGINPQGCRPRGYLTKKWLISSA
jgi:polyphosphate kinase 2 (PPK2 family)